MARNTRTTVQDEGVEIKILAPECKMEDIVVTNQENSLIIEIPDNDFTGRCRYQEDFSDVLNVAESTASLSEGVLSIKIPYEKIKKPNRIPIT